MYDTERNPRTVFGDMDICLPICMGMDMMYRKFLTYIPTQILQMHKIAGECTLVAITVLDTSEVLLGTLSRRYAMANACGADYIIRTAGLSRNVTLSKDSACDFAVSLSSSRVTKLSWCHLLHMPTIQYCK